MKAQAFPRYILFLLSLFLLGSASSQALAPKIPDSPALLYDRLSPHEKRETTGAIFLYWLYFHPDFLWEKWLGISPTSHSPEKVPTVKNFYRFAEERWGAFSGPPADPGTVLFDILAWQKTQFSAFLLQKEPSPFLVGVSKGLLHSLKDAVANVLSSSLLSPDDLAGASCFLNTFFLEINHSIREVFLSSLERSWRPSFSLDAYLDTLLDEFHFPGRDVQPVKVRLPELPSQGLQILLSHRAETRNLPFLDYNTQLENRNGRGNRPQAIQFSPWQDTLAILAPNWKKEYPEAYRVGDMVLALLKRWWTRKTRGISELPPPKNPGVYKILCVCAANQYSSIKMEETLRDVLQKNGLNYVLVASGGYVVELEKDKLASFDEPSPGPGKGLSPQVLEDADLIILPYPNLIYYLPSHFPQVSPFSHKLFSLRDLAFLDNDHIRPDLKGEILHPPENPVTHYFDHWKEVFTGLFLERIQGMVSVSENPRGLSFSA